jgi:5-methylcytosine-specific restriction endonuclease McrA
MTIRWSQAEREQRAAYRKQQRERRDEALIRTAVVKGSHLVGHEPVEATPRKAMTPARRKRIWDRDNGQCGECGTPVPLKGTVVDHDLGLFQGGPDNDENCRFLCARCDDVKTNTVDAKINAKIRRLKAEHERDEPKPPSKIPSRPFPEDYQPLAAGRRFPSSRQKAPQ